jgi:solute:Na+ symporter, SSS family
MHTADWIVLIGYLGGTVLMGVLLGRLIKNSADFFAAGEQSPWWVSGLSAFMTMFSANTFVVWGGVAYKYGIVAIMINLMYGVAALLAGYFVAGRWKRLGIRTPAEFVEKRFGRRALHFYTWSMMTLRVVGSAGALYAIAKLIIVVISGSDSATTGLNWAILAFGLIIVIYTMVGGLWAVLMTDVLQFIILNLAVIAVIPLALMKMGTLGEIVSAAPEGFWSPTAGPKYTWFLLLGWLAIHYFMIGAEWAFVQRYLCVPTAKDARKSTYLFGALYLISPFLWLLPPLLWRISNPIPAGATESEITNLAENAYILSCKSVLPVGLIGLMLAAMFSATASLVSAQLNVFSGVLTSDIYRAFRPNSDERRLVKVGRFFTVVLGVIVTGIALAIPILGGAERVIVAATEMMVVPLLAPTLWGLFNRRVPARALWLTAGICFPLGLLFRFALPAGDEGLLGWLHTNAKLIETFIGVGLPLLITAWVAHTAREESPGWAKVAALERPPEGSVEPPKPSPIPALIVGYSMGACSLMMAALLFVNDDNHAVLLSFALVLAAISGTTFFIAARTRRASKEVTHI